jgi:TonB family protein
MALHKIFASRLGVTFIAVVLATSLLSGCDNPKSQVKELKSMVQVSYGAHKYKESGKAAADGLKIALANFGPKNPDTLYFAQAISEANIKLGDKKNAVSALNREIDLRIGAGQTEEKLQVRRTTAIKFAEEMGDRATAAKQAVAISKAIGMKKGMDPQPVYRPESIYPPDLFLRGVEGDVTVSYALDTNGSVLDAKIIKATPKEVFDKAALANFLTWRFTPMLENGSPVKSGGHQFTLMFRMGKAKQ